LIDEQGNVFESCSFPLVAYKIIRNDCAQFWLVVFEIEANGGMPIDGFRVFLSDSASLIDTSLDGVYK
jgi:hypothetical protein